MFCGKLAFGILLGFAIISMAFFPEYFHWFMVAYKKLFLVLLWSFIIVQLSAMKKFKCRARMKEFYSELTRFSY